MPADQGLDEVGYWTEVKLDILRDYASAYSRIMSKQKSIRHYAYIDGFAGAGTHISETKGVKIEGSPAIALGIEPPFSQYHFIDMNSRRVKQLSDLAAGRNNVKVYDGDCNKVLLDQIFPQCRYEQYRRALCLLDPYKLNPDWQVVQAAGKMRSVEIFLNFMIMDANMNVFWKNPNKVATSQIARMNAFWGDESWRKAAYVSTPTLFGDEDEKASNEAVVAAYRDRLKKVAGFKYVPEPMPMRNTRGAVVYYLFFASHNSTGDKIIQAVFEKHKHRGA